MRFFGESVGLVNKEGYTAVDVYDEEDVSLGAKELLEVTVPIITGELLVLLSSEVVRVDILSDELVEVLVLSFFVYSSETGKGSVLV